MVQVDAKEKSKQIINRLLEKFPDINVDRRNLEKAVNEILQEITVRESVFANETSIISQDEFLTILKTVYQEANGDEPRFRGIIPLDIIKKKISKKQLNLSEQKIDELILDLEDQRIIDLQTAYDSGTIKEPEYGIKVPGRGLVYFLIFRPCVH